ncbi:MAG: AsmA family protein, partial [Edwardsiella sp. (in: enterobacteria)]
MKVIGKLLLTLCVLILLALAAAYFIVQSRWGARQISDWVNQHTHYRITLSALQHTLGQPATVQVNGFSLARASQPPLIQSATLRLTFGWQQLSAPRHFSAISLSGGKLTLTQDGIPPLPISAAA